MIISEKELKVVRVPTSVSVKKGISILELLNSAKHCKKFFRQSIIKAVYL